MYSEVFVPLVGLMRVAVHTSLLCVGRGNCANGVPYHHFSLLSNAHESSTMPSTGTVAC